jgi:hypothetical protein
VGFVVSLDQAVVQAAIDYIQAKEDFEARKGSIQTVITNLYVLDVAVHALLERKGEQQP